jgi:glutamate-1-semialdehyde 2,1-aminomutase
MVDEVKTGFRAARAAPAAHGLKGDLCTLAKAMAMATPSRHRRARGRHAPPPSGTHGGTYTAGASPGRGRAHCASRDTDALDRVAGYGRALQAGISRILSPRGIPHCFAGHPSMNGLFFREEPPRNYRDWKRSDYTFYDTLAQFLLDDGVLCEPDSREPWFVCAAHDEACLAHTLRAFEAGVVSTLDVLSTARREPAAKEA